MDEWLEVYITKNINNITDLYTLKTETKVHIFNTNSNGGNLYPKEIVILVTPPNYEIENFTEQQKNEYTKLAKESAESIIENYGIKKDYVIKVKFLD